MNARCTCGVDLVEGARFCHKCGRPVDGFEPVIEEPPPMPPPLPVAAPEPALVETAAREFQNRIAVRSGVTAAAILFVPAMVLATTLGAPVMAAAPLLMGSLAVFLHSRRTGRTMSVIEGARQGWLSGLFFFLIVLVLMTLLFVLVSSNPEMIPMMKDQAKAKGTLTPETAQFFDQMQRPDQFAGAILMSALFLFVMFTSLSSLGGILGTRLFGARRTN